MLLKCYFIAVIYILRLAIVAVGEFAFTTVPGEVVLGSTYKVAWSGTDGNYVELRLRRSPINESWYPYIYGGYDDQVFWTASASYDLELNNLYIFALSLYMDNEVETFYTSPFVVQGVKLISPEDSSTTITSGPSVSAQVSTTLVSSLSTNTTKDSLRTATPTNTPQTAAKDEEQDKLSPGAIAGISVGSIGALAVAALVVLIFYRQKRSMKAAALQQAGQSSPVMTVPAIAVKKYPVNFLDGQPVSYELSPDSTNLRTAAELDTNRSV